MLGVLYEKCSFQETGVCVCEEVSYCYRILFGRCVIGVKKWCIYTNLTVPDYCFTRKKSNAAEMYEYEEEIGKFSHTNFKH